MWKQALRLGYFHLCCWHVDSIIYDHPTFSFFFLFFLVHRLLSVSFNPGGYFQTLLKKKSNQISWLFSQFKICTKCWQLMPWAEKHVQSCTGWLQENWEWGEGMDGWKCAHWQGRKCSNGRRQGLPFRWAQGGLQLMEFVTLNAGGSGREHWWSGKEGKFRLNYVRELVNRLWKIRISEHQLSSGCCFAQRGSQVKSREN